MRVSVIIPFTAEDADLSHRAIRSTETQTVSPWEVIPVYDREHRGPSWSRNLGVAQATGDLILPLDADDWIEPTFLEKTIERMMGRPDIGIVSTDMQYFGELDGYIIPTYVRSYASQLQANEIPCCSLVRAEAIGAAGMWDSNLDGWEDWDMWIRILRLGYKHDAVPEVLFHYRKGQSGVSGRADRKLLRAKMAAKHAGFKRV